jgi:hypothetical protein
VASIQLPDASSSQLKDLTANHNHYIVLTIYMTSFEGLRNIVSSIPELDQTKNYKIGIFCFFKEQEQRLVGLEEK